MIPCSGSDEYGVNAAGDTAAENDQENCEAREAYQLEVGPGDAIPEFLRILEE